MESWQKKKKKKESGGERGASLLGLAWTLSCRPDAGVFGLQVHHADPFVTLLPNQAVGVKLWDLVLRRHQLDHHPGRTLIIIDLKHMQHDKGQVPLPAPEPASVLTGFHFLLCFLFSPYLFMISLFCWIKKEIR